MSMFNRPTINQSTVFSANQSLEAFFHSGVSLHKLQAGDYGAKIHNATIVSANTSDPNSKPYVRVELQLLDDGRIIVDNRFQTGFQIMIDQLKTQLGMDSLDIAVQDLIAHCKQHSFRVWITYQEVEDKTYRNVNYREPKVVQPTAEIATEVVY